MPTYVMLGHGSEIPVKFENRKTMPAGTTLVTAVQCGHPSMLDRLTRVVQTLRENPEIAGNPDANTSVLNDMLGFDIHVYGPGEPYPFLLFDAEAVFKEPTRYVLSGVVNLDDLTDDDMDFIQNSRVLENEEAKQDLVTQSFRRSRFPTAAQAVPVIMEKGYYNVTHGLEQIFQELGPGVYYYPICRGDSGLRLARFPHEHPLYIRQKSTDEQERRKTRGRGRGKRMKKRLTKRRKYGARRTTLRLV